MKQYFVTKCNNAKCNNIYWYNWEIWEFAFLCKMLQRCAALKMLPWNITFIVAIATNGQLTFTTKIFVEKITELNLTTILSRQERLEIDKYCFWVYLGVRTRELFLCFATSVFLGSIVMTSLFSLFHVNREFNRFLHRGWALFLE